MDRRALLIDFEIVEKALSTFSVTVVNGGKRLFEEKRVRSLKETARSNTFEAEVTEKGKVHAVTLSYGGSSWNLLCTCPLGTECKHVYAALLSLSKRFRKKAVVSEKNTQTAGQRDNYFALVQTPADLTENETDWVERLEAVYQSHVEGSQINGRVLKGLFPKWPDDEYWSEIKIAPRKELSRAQFWHFMIASLRRRGLTIPLLFGDWNNTDDSEHLIEAWRTEQSVFEWTKKYERDDEPAICECCASDFRWAIDGQDLCLQIKSSGEAEYLPIRSTELQRLATDWRTGRVHIPSERLPLLLQHFLADGFQPPARLTIGAGLAARLNSLFRLDGVRSRTIAGKGRALELEAAAWEMSEVSQHRYRFQLSRGGKVPGSDLLMFPGPTTLYLSGSTLLEASPPPFPTDSLRCPSSVDIPRAAVESVPGIRYAINSVPVLPESLAARVSRVQPRRELRILLREDDGSVALAPRLVDPRIGTEITTEFATSWRLPGKHVIRDGDVFVAYELSGGTSFEQFIAGLPSEYDLCSRQWRIKAFGRAVERVAKWVQSLPDDIELQTPEALRGLSQKLLEIDLSIDWAEAGNDWFDLRFSWPEGDLVLSPGELQLLLAARGNPVQFPSRAYRSLRVGRAGKLLDALDELGISARELAAGPQRLHIMHLRALLEAGVVPKELGQQLETRLAEIQVQVAPEVPETIEATLRPYQLAGFHFLAYLSTNRFGGILADDMGLGKTLQTLTWIAWLQKTYPVTGPILIICPKSVVETWIQEAACYFPSLPVTGLRKPDLGTESLMPGQVLILNYTQLRLAGESLKDFHWDAVVFDEGQNLKNTASQTTQSARALNARHKILLTGTPIENRLLDLWSLMHCVMPGALGTQSAFKREFEESGDSNSRARLARRIRPFLLRRTKEEVVRELPPKIEEDIRVQMDREQEDLYHAELKVARQHLLQVTQENQLDKERFNLLAALLRLRQICCHPALAGLKTATGAKLEALLDLLDPLVEEGNKILVFSQFVEMLNLIEERVKALACPIFKLTGQTENRGDLIGKFQQQEGSSIFLISLRAGGTGLNLAAASYVILFDPWWNPAVENQAVDRVHRIGQTKTVFAYRLLICDSIEDKIRRLQIHKSNLAGDVLGEEGFGRALTLDDFRYLME
jgi:SNF2-related domain/Helicase conserved C-terminal domain